MSFGIPGLDDQQLEPQLAGLDQPEVEPVPQEEPVDAFQDFPDLGLDEPFFTEGDDVVDSDEEQEAEDPESSHFINLAEELEDEELARIGDEVVTGFENDKDSLSELDDMRTRWTSLYDMQVEKKNEPWENASNVKTPNIAKACVNFMSRASINVLGGNKIVKGFPWKVNEPVIRKSKRVAKYMNVQLTVKDKDFRPGFDKTLIQLPRDGHAFRKQYWDNEKKMVISDYLLNEDFVCNYYTKSLETSNRYTQVLHLTENDIKIKMESGIYIEYDNLGMPSESQASDKVTREAKKEEGHTEPEVDYATPRDILEVHTYVTLKKDDDIREPYVITVDRETRQVLRIISRKNPTTNKPILYFTNYEMIPNDRSIYAMGFGIFLLGITASMNTSINQLTDAGHLQNTQGGFVLKGSSIKRGALRFSMGEYKEISSNAKDIRQILMPMPSATPSGTLMSLLEFLKSYSEEFTTVTEIFSGGQPRSDTTATSSEIAREEGSKVFTGIQQRIHRSFQKELDNIRTLNAIFVDDADYQEVVDDLIKPEDGLVSARADFSSEFEVMPVSDPNIISKQQSIAVAEHFFKIVSETQFLNQDPRALKKATMQRLEAMGETEEAIKEIETIFDEQIDMQNKQKKIQEGDLRVQEQGQNLQDALKLAQGQEQRQLRQEQSQQPQQ